MKSVDNEADRLVVGVHTHVCYACIRGLVATDWAVHLDLDESQAVFQDYLGF